MSRHPPDQQSYHRHRTLPQPHVPNRVFPTDPAGYISSTPDSYGWREKNEPFEELLPIKGENRAQYLDSPTLAPIRNSRIAQGSQQPGTSRGYNVSERSTQTTPHLRRLEKRPSERPAPAAHESQKSSRSDGGRSGPPAKHRKRHNFSESEQDNILGYIKARMSWRQISQKMNLDQDSIQTHWYRYLSKEPRVQAEGVRYDPDYRV